MLAEEEVLPLMQVDLVIPGTMALMPRNSKNLNHLAEAMVASVVEAMEASVEEATEVASVETDKTSKIATTQEEEAEASAVVAEVTEEVVVSETTLTRVKMRTNT